MNRYKLLQVLCDSDGATIEVLKVGQVYEFNHRKVDVLDSEGNPVMKVIEVEANGYKSNILPDSFTDFLEEVGDGEEV